MFHRLPCQPQILLLSVVLLFLGFSYQRGLADDPHHKERLESLTDAEILDRAGKFIVLPYTHGVLYPSLESEVVRRRSPAMTEGLARLFNSVVDSDPAVTSPETLVHPKDPSLLNHASPALQLIDLIRRQATGESWEFLRTLLGSPHPLIAAGTMDALRGFVSSEEERHFAELLPLIRPRLVDPSPVVRYSAVRAMGSAELHVEECITALEAIDATEKEEGVRGCVDVGLTQLRQVKALWAHIETVRRGSTRECLTALCGLKSVNFQHVLREAAIQAIADRAASEKDEQLKAELAERLEKFQKFDQDAKDRAKDSLPLPK